MSNGTVEVALVGERLSLLAAATDLPLEADVTIAIRPESIRLVETTANGEGSPDRAGALEVTVTEASFLGDHYEYSLRAGSIELIAQSQNPVSAPALTAIIEPSACAVVSDNPQSHPSDGHDAGGVTRGTNGNGSSVPRYAAG
jgi:ABC-type Fe3+/spermidine/putrescine transport system ATPase subunit